MGGVVERGYRWMVWMEWVWMLQMDRWVVWMVQIV